MKILVKQFPNLIEGIQYVGMVKPILSDFEYVITDMDGVIDSFTKGITGFLGLSPNIFKDKDSQINIQILAPDLISFFSETYQRGGKIAKSKFREPGGEPLTLIVPQDFSMIAKSEVKSSGARSSAKNRGHRNQQSNHRGRSNVFRTFLKALQKTNKRPNAAQSNRDKMPTAAQLLAANEYVKCERKKDVQCEILFHEFKMNSTESTKMIVFKLSKNVVEKDHKGIGEELGGPGFVGRMGSKKFDNRDNTKNKKKSSQSKERSLRQTDNESLQSMGDGQQNDDNYYDDDGQGTNGGFNMQHQETHESQKRVGFQDVEQDDAQSEHYA
jgi:hypothetical protein